MEIILIRHGQSEGNALSDKDKVFSGQWDCALTEKGYMQASELKNDPIFDNVDTFFSSDLKRAIETARVITEQEIIIDPRLRERSLGDFDGKRIEDIKIDEKYKKYFSDPEYMSFRESFTCKAPNGESLGDVCKRVKPFLEEVYKKKYRKIVIVAHYMVIKCLIKEIEGLSEEETLSLRIHNCQPIRIMCTPCQGQFKKLG